MVIPLIKTSKDTPISAIPTASHSVINPKTVRIAKVTLTIIEVQIFCLMILLVLFVISKKVIIFFKSSLIIITSAVSKVKSVAEAPIAIPKSDKAKAGASFIPSPTIATPLNFFFNLSISSNFWSGNNSPW